MRLVLTSVHKGKTIRFGPYQFVNGAIELPGDYATNEGTCKYLRTCYQAVPDWEIKEQEHGAGEAGPGGPGEVAGDLRPAGPGPAEAPGAPGGGDAPPAAGDPGAGPDGDRQPDARARQPKGRKREAP